MSIDVMKQALEALERGETKLRYEAITALRERLAQPEQESVKFNCTVVDDAHPKGVPLGQWGKQQKQKPFCYHDGRNIVGKEYVDHSDVFPLYARPQAREPLTDEEIERACAPLGAAMLSFTEVARAIEAKLKEKNT